MTGKHIGRCALAIAGMVGLAACSTAHMDTAPTASTEQLYAALYPYYAELCALSELKKKPGFGAEISSGMGGHSVFYLNGVCRDDPGGYPEIRLCDEATAGAHGVGISVNAHYKNANWIATEDREFFFHGGLQPGEPVTRAAYARTQATAKAKGILDGVEFHTEVLAEAPKGMSERDYKYEVSIATDYAIGFGRDRYCARVPLDRARMARIVDYMNGLNVDYRDGKKEFDWDVLRNNCSHVAHNALAAAGVWDEWETNRSFLISAFDFPVPKNEFVNLMQRTNDVPIDRLDEVYDDDAARRALMTLGTLPSAPGSIAEAEPAVAQNEVYDTDLALIFYDDPITGRYRHRFERIFSEPRYTDLRANLLYFADRYREAERERPPLAAFLDRRHPVTSAERADLTAFYDRYYRYVDRESAAVATELASLPRAETVRPVAIGP
ncbi:MAG TPA: hypothetical protein VMU85_06110 [Stellaceae bacterium]|nr:hypothetical protein [Stellaceae bacterium]